MLGWAILKGKLLTHVSEKINMSSGIYQITNIINNKIYIGSSSNIEKRWKKHKTELNTKNHHSKHLENAWHLYGHDKFKFSVLEVIHNTNDLLSREQHYLDYYKPYLEENGYNVCHIAGSTIGIKRTENERIVLSKHFNNKSCLSFDAAEEIRTKYASGNYSHRSLAKEYNTSKTTIKEIIYYKRWNLNNVPENKERNTKKINSGVRVLSNEQIDEIIKLKPTLTLKELSIKFNVKVGVITRIVYNKKFIKTE